MVLRGIRGATSVSQDTPDEILTATRELLDELLRANEIADFHDIASVLFTTTSDLKSIFPAEAARYVGMDHVPLLCAMEIPVPGSLGHCIRVLMHVNTDKKQDEITHVYLHEAKSLRPDMNGAK